MVEWMRAVSDALTISRSCTASSGLAAGGLAAARAAGREPARGRWWLLPLPVWSTGGSERRAAAGGGLRWAARKGPAAESWCSGGATAGGGAGRGESGKV